MPIFPLFKKHTEVQELAAVPVILWNIDAKGDILLSEGSALAQLGLTPGQLVGQSVFEVYKDDPKAMEFIRRGLAGEEFDAEVEVGGRTWGNYYVPHRTGGKVTGLIGVSVDITDKKQVEKSLQESEAKYHRIFETTNEGVWIVDREHNTTSVNPRLLQILGYTEGDMLGSKVEDFIVPEDLTSHQKQVYLLQEGQSSVYEQRFVRKDGSIVWCSVSATPVFFENSKFGGSFAMIADITDRKQAEEALRQSEKHLRSVISAAPVILWDTDSAGIIQLSEGNALSQLGLAPGQLVGQSVFEVYKSDPKAVEFIRRGLAGEEFTTEIEVGGRYWHNSYTPRRDDSGAVLGLIGVSMDITERAVAERKVTTYLGELETANKLMIGRELKMVELKEEIEELKKKLPQK